MSFSNKVDYYNIGEKIKNHLINKEPSFDLHLECGKSWIPFINCPRSHFMGHHQINNILGPIYYMVKEIAILLNARYFIIKRLQLILLK